jgi:hypothetical protein
VFYSLFPSPPSLPLLPPSRHLTLSRTLPQGLINHRFGSPITCPGLLTPLPFMDACLTLHCSAGHSDSAHLSLLPTIFCRIILPRMVSYTHLTSSLISFCLSISIIPCLSAILSLTLASRMGTITISALFHAGRHRHMSRSLDHHMER